MKSKVYDLMNWPEIEGVTYVDTTQPGELLGGHMCKDGFLIQIFRPDAVEVSVNVDQAASKNSAAGKPTAGSKGTKSSEKSTPAADSKTGQTKKYECEKVDEAGYFAVLIPGKSPVDYTINVETKDGKVVTYSDPYSFAPKLDEADVRKFNAGNSFDAYRFMGAHETEIDGTEGTLYAVWAPYARRVSVVGEFNGWDGRICQMNEDESGIFTLFVPGVSGSEPYCYEIKMRDGQNVRKADPYYTGDNDLSFDYIWDDDGWKASFSKEAPLAVCELDAEVLTDRDCVDKVKKLGFNCVELSGVVAGADEDGIAVGNYCVDKAIGADRLKSVIDEFHKNGIAVIMDCNLAYMNHGVGCLVYYDGTHLYDAGETRFADGSVCSSYDYSKPQVRDYVYSTVDYWLSQFHADGIRMSDVAAMLYLDYGKNAGEWIPNIYGGAENLDATQLIVNIRKYVDKLDKSVLMIAEENSIWAHVTDSVKDEGLGFDYRWNNGWKEDFLDFYVTDPLFRKGKYEQLTHSMLYQYSENFMLEFSRAGVGADITSSAPVPADLSDDERLELTKAHVRSAIGYMYAYPGKKLVSYRDCEGIENYVADINKAYFDNKALNELDDSPEGFEWLNISSVNETVISFVRKSKDGSMVLCAANFTPVDREVFKMGVSLPGKYTDMATGKTFKTVSEEYDGRDETVDLELPGLALSMFSYKPYTELEQRENAIISEAKAAFAEAERCAQLAKEREEEAKARAVAAKEAEEQARKAAEEASNASKEAHKQAADARKRCEQIEQDARKKLEALRK